MIVEITITILLIIIIAVQIKQKKEIREIEDEIFELKDDLFWQNSDDIIERLNNEQTNKRRILGESDRSNEHKEPERNGKKKHVVWT